MFLPDARFRFIFLSAIFLSVFSGEPGRDAVAADGNRLTYLDGVNPWYPGTGFPKLVTPQWVGEEGVEAVVVLAIDDMRESAKYEQYLRPILNRLKAIDGRAPVSIMSCSVQPDDPQLAQWLDEGLSIEVHTVDHPCPLLQGADFAKAKSTYDRCVDLMHEIPGNKPVAFRTPCCDSLNTVSPRFFAEIFNRTTEKGHYLEIDSSVFNLFTADDPEIPRELLFDPDGREKFRKYLPKALKRGDREFNTFVNYIENYPYPYVIGGTCWEFPCMVPSDWSAQHLQGVNNPDTVRDWKAALDITVLKQGVFCLVFHPHGWIKPEQVVELIDHAVAKHGRKVKFLTFREALGRLNRNLLGGEALRFDARADLLIGLNSGIQILDVNNDGFMDVVAANHRVQQTRVWQPATNTWLSCDTPFRFVVEREFRDAINGQLRKEPRFADFAVGVLDADGSATVIDLRELNAWSFHRRSWLKQVHLPAGMKSLPDAQISAATLRDINGDGVCEILIPIAEGSKLRLFQRSRLPGEWEKRDWTLPVRYMFARMRGSSYWSRFVDIDDDGHDDLVYSDDSQYSVHLWQDMETGWNRTVLSHKRGDADARVELPPIGLGQPDAITIPVTLPTNNGFFVHSRHLFWQNEDTADELDLVYRVSFDELLKDVRPGPKSPEASLKCMQVPPGFEVELVAAEPLIADPVAFEWGADGRLWVAEMGDYPLGADGDRRKEAQEAQKDAPGENGPADGGRVRVLEDVDGDGRYDRSTVFLEGLNFPSGVLPWRNGVLVTAAPDLLYAEDTDGDGRADVRVVLFTGFGEGNQQHRVNGFAYGLDNWVYCANGDSDGVIRFENVVPRSQARESRTPDSQALPESGRGSGSRDDDRSGGARDATRSVADVRSQAEPGNEGREINISGRDFRFRPDTGEFELVTGRTQFGRNRDDWGNWFGCNNSNPMWHFVLEDRYLRRNPHLAPPDPKVPVSVAPGPAACFPISREMPRFNDFDRLNRFTSACSTIVYRDELFGPEFAGNSFVSEPVHNLVHREVMEPRGVTFTSRRADSEQQSEFIASRDNWFRPTMIKTGPDGALWVADMYRLVIEHPQYIPREQWDEWDFGAGSDRGRIYRVFPRSVVPRSPDRGTGATGGLQSGGGRDEQAGDLRSGGRRGQETRAEPSRARAGATQSVVEVRSHAEPGNEGLPRLDRLTTGELVAALDSPNGWRRDTAQRLLVHSPDRQASPRLRQMTMQSPRPLARLHALCTLDGLGELAPAVVHVKLGDQHPGVRRHAVRLAERWLTDASEAEAGDLGRAIAALADDPDPHVRLQVAYTLGEWKHPAAGAPLAAIALADPGDPWLITAVLSSLNESNIEPVLSAALRSAPRSEAAAGFLDRLLAQAGAIGDAETLASVLDAITRPGQRNAHELWQLTATARFLESLHRSRDDWKPDDRLQQQVHALLDEARRLAADESGNVEPEQRLAAIELLPLHPRAVEQIETLAALLSPRHRSEVQSAAVAALGRIDDRRTDGSPAASALLAGWKPLSPALRSQVLDVLLSRTRWTAYLLERIADGAIAAAEIDAAHRQQLLAHRDERLRKRAEDAFASRIDPDRRKVLEAYSAAVSTPGDAVAGRQVFVKACATCHRLGDAGHEVGPDLAALTDKSTQALLVAILDPNRAVESKYVNYVAVTVDGRQHTGLLAAETGNSITLVGPENKRAELLRRDLEELTSTSKSTMPEGLEKDLTPGDVANVIAYVQTNAAARWPKTFSGNHPATVTPDGDDALELSARLAEIYGPTLVFETQHGNLGYWGSANDEAVWTIEVPRDGQYRIEVEWACHNDTAGNSIVFTCAGEQATKTVRGTGTWDDYAREVFGTLALTAGRQKFQVRAGAGLKGYLMDLKSVRLVPVN